MAGDRLMLTRSIANRTLAALERYEPNARKLAGNWRDVELYTRTGAQLEEVRRCCADLPMVSRPWVELLIAHAELVHCLWHSARPQPTTTDPARQQKLEKVISSCAALRTACIRIATSDDPPH
jgi:hypothetical protein